MKHLILLVCFLIQYQNVHCDFNNYIGDWIIDFSQQVTKVYDQVISTIKNALFNNTGIPPSVQEDEDVQPYILEEKLKQSFNDFITKVAAASYFPESLKFRSEPTALMNTPQLAALHGRRIESHVIKTKDNYILTLHRVFNGTAIPDRTVLLHHGLMGSSADWILLGPLKSLPYILSDAGYDVWMTNARGSYYSRGHMKHRVNTTSFWKFSFEEVGLYDLPATIKYVKKFKNYDEKLHFVGHSMGATAFLVLLSTYPSYNEYFRVGVLLAPLAFMSQSQGPLKLLNSMSNSPPSNYLKMIGNTEFLPSRTVPKMLASKFCTGPKLYCSNPLLFLAGGIREDELEEGFLARLLYHVPAGASTNTILHYGQLAQNGRFHRFREPSAEFDLSNVKIPMAFFTSSDDWLSTVPDVFRLYFSVSNPIEHYVIRCKNLSHTELVWGYDADQLVFPKVLDIIVKGPDYKAEKENEV